MLKNALSLLKIRRALGAPPPDSRNSLTPMMNSWLRAWLAQHDLCWLQVEFSWWKKI